MNVIGIEKLINPANTINKNPTRTAEDKNKGTIVLNVKFLVRSMLRPTQIGAKHKKIILELIIATSSKCVIK